MTWQDYPFFTFLTIGLWLLGCLILYIGLKKPKLRLIAEIIILAGIGAIVYFTIFFWIGLERPPFRTLAETRLWYSLFMAIIGIVIYYRWRLPWMLLYSLGIAALFLYINHLNPDTYNKDLMPALQSPWFIPHVIVYIFAYALLGASSVIAIKGLVFVYLKKPLKQTLQFADNIVYIGFAFLTFGLLFGALWAKEAWGHYWTWDPKETWAFLTWLMYLIYIHIRYRHKKQVLQPLWMLALAFIILLICWFGVNYLPSAASSVHVY
ncbi:cytochrome c biogenesis protein CcsA [Bacteroidota bacterium]